MAITWQPALAAAFSGAELVLLKLLSAECSGKLEHAWCLTCCSEMLGSLAFVIRDDRTIEAVAFGLPLRSAPLFVDITLVSPLKADGSPAHNAHNQNGAAATEAEHRKRAKYPELATSADAQLQVVALETGGRWSDAAAAFVSDLAWAKAESAPLLLRAATAHAWRARWSAVIAVAAQASFAASLLGGEPAAAAGCDGTELLLSELLSQPSAPSCSRLPAR